MAAPVAHHEILADITPDRPLMQSVLELSSSTQARELASAWIAAFDTALAIGARPDEAQARADDAYRAAARRAGLPFLARRAA
jgi:hypothetical protein